MWVCRELSGQTGRLIRGPVRRDMIPGTHHSLGGVPDAAT